MGCLNCGRGFHGECFNGPNRKKCCCAYLSPKKFGHKLPQPDKVVRGRPHKDNEALQDPLSSWRKRATVAYPLDKTKPCDWKGKKDCGGGKYPIVGCINGMQSTLHHGPVKIEEGVSFNFNDPDNIHLLCERCHHLWHHWNDAVYDFKLYSTLPHNPVEAPNELLETWANSNTRPKAPEPRTKPIEIGAD